MGNTMSSSDAVMAAISRVDAGIRRSAGPPSPRLAVLARSPDLDDRAVGRKAGFLRCGADAAGEAVVVEMGCLAAAVADQEDAVVQAVRMVVGDIGVGALDAARE